MRLRRLPAATRDIQASDDKRGTTTVNFLDHVGHKLLRTAVVRGRMNDTQIWGQLEFEGVEAKGQSLPDGFERRFLEAPELEKSPQALQTACPFNSIRLGCPKLLLSEFYSLKVPRMIFDIDADSVRRRPGSEKTEPAGGKTEPEIR